MDLTFTKGSGKYDQMRIIRGTEAEVIECPKQRIIPHDMMHYAVESVLKQRGFLSRVLDGETAEFRMSPDALSDSVERLVEVFQGDAWSDGATSPEDMLDLYRVTCSARGSQMLAAAPEDIVAVRKRIYELDAQWQGLAVGETMQLQM